MSRTIEYLNTMKTCDKAQAECWRLRRCCPDLLVVVLVAGGSSWLAGVVTTYPGPGHPATGYTGPSLASLATDTTNTQSGPDQRGNWSRRTQRIDS